MREDGDDCDDGWSRGRTLTRKGANPPRCGEQGFLAPPDAKIPGRRTRLRRPEPLSAAQAQCQREARRGEQGPWASRRSGSCGGARALSGRDDGEPRMCIDAASADFGDEMVSAGRDLSWRRVGICPGRLRSCVGSCNHHSPRAASPNGGRRESTTCRRPPPLSSARARALTMAGRPAPQERPERAAQQKATTPRDGDASSSSH